MLFSLHDPKRPHVMQKVNTCRCLCHQIFYRNKLPKKYSSHLWHGPLTAKRNMAPNHIQRNCTHLCTESTPRNPCGRHTDIYGNSNKWMGLCTNIFSCITRYFNLLVFIGLVDEINFIPIWHPPSANMAAAN